MGFLTRWETDRKATHGLDFSVQQDKKKPAFFSLFFFNKTNILFLKGPLFARTIFARCGTTCLEA